MKKKTIGKRILAVVMALCVVMMYSVVAFAEEGTGPVCPDHPEGVMELVEDSDTATCGEAGTVKYKCNVEIAGEEEAEPTVCGKTVEVESPATGNHVSDAGVITTPATCINDGVKTYSCNVCDEVLDTETVEATGVHSYGKDGRCTTEGCDASIALSDDTVAVIGETQYSSLDDAINAANNGDTIVVLEDTASNGITTGMSNNDEKAVPREGVASIENHEHITVTSADKVNITFNDYGIRIRYGSCITFDNVNVAINTGLTKGTSGELGAVLVTYGILAGEGSELKLKNATLSMKYDQVSNYHGIYLWQDSRISLIDSILNIDGYDYGVTGEGIIAHVSAVNSEMNFTNSKSTAYAANYCVTELDNSTMTANNLQTKKRGISVYCSAKMILKNNSKVSVCNGVFETGKTDRGAFVVKELEVDGTSGVELKNNKGMGLNEYSGGNSFEAKITIADGAKLDIEGNTESGIYNNGGTIDIASGTIVNNGSAAANGGGIYNNGGTVTIADGVKLYDNHVSAAGDDIYNTADGTINLGKACSEKLSDCSDIITGWFYDGEGDGNDDARWNVNHSVRSLSAVPYAKEFTDSTVTGAIALKAAHGDFELSYKFTGDVPEGKTAPEAAKYVAGKTVTLAAAPSADGYTFDGWYNGNTKVTGTLTMPANDVELIGKWKKNDTTPETPGTIIPTPDTPQNPPQDNPDVNPDGNPDDIPSDNPEDKPSVDPNGGSDAIDGDDSVDSDPMGDPDAIDDEKDISAEPNGVKTGDSTDMIPWALGFGTAVMLLGGAVALRRREE